MMIYLITKIAKCYTQVLFVSGVLLLVGCGGSSDSSPPAITPPPVTIDAEAGFPESLSVASPLNVAVEAQASSAQIQKTMASAPDVVESVLADPSLLTTLLNVMEFYRAAGDAQQCYGPTLDYENHVDATMGSANGELPSGDLGIWVATMPDADTDGIAEACAAAQLNARMAALESRSTMALVVVAAMKAAYDASGSADISSYAPADVTFSNTSIELSADESTSTYTIDIAYDKTSDSVDEVITLEMVHHENPDDANINEGLLTIRVMDEFNGGNCGGGTNEITRYTSVHYHQTSENSLALQAREAAFCGSGVTEMAGHAALTEAVAAVSAEITGNVLDPSASWADNFSVFTAAFDPTPDAEGELAGSYSYVWQAGSNDSHSRILDLELTVGLGGESYFGFGDKVQTTTAVDEFGIIRGMICNWAGPNNNHTPRDYAQRQHLTLDASVGFYVPTNVAASDITYAPTNTCSYDGSGTFVYDRDLDGTLGETSTEVAVGVGFEDAGTGLELDLMAVGASRTDIWDTITNDRNYSLPVYPN